MPHLLLKKRSLKAILEKAEKSDSMVETMHSMEVSDPLVANSFACTITLDVTMKGSDRMHMTELYV